MHKTYNHNIFIAQVYIDNIIFRSTNSKLLKEFVDIMENDLIIVVS